MSQLIARESQQLQQDAIVTLFELDATRFGEGVLRFCPAPVDGGPAMFNGYQYQPLPIQADGFEWSGQGTLPRPTLSITAMQLAFLSLVLSADDLVGAPFKRLRTYRKHLDDGDDPDAEALFPVDHYTIERKQAQNRTAITFELSVEMDQQGRKIPARQVLRDSCTHRYRWWTGEWEPSGSAADPGDDKCGKRLSDCRLRFGQNGVLPTRAFPGVGRV